MPRPPVFAVLAAATLALPTAALANSSGKTGKSTSGCSSCHGSSADTDVTAAFSAPVTEAAPGDVVTITFTVSTVDSAQTHAGLNVSASGGTFSAGTATQVSGGEITHTGATAMSGGTATFTFDWTAPSTEATYTFSGVGNAVNNNGASGAGDGWDLATDITIEVVDPCSDLDGDGSTDCDGDCDETDATVYPGATELCDGIDQDCDGVVDNGVSYYDWYPDDDGDGYGDPAGPSTYDCIAPGSGYANNGDDCDDTDATISPDALEICDGIDQDCDTVIDNGAGTSEYWPDLDGDGFGDADAEAEIECFAPEDYVDNDDDCDDTDDGVSPDADEVWYDGIDQDCRGDDDYDQDRDGRQTAELGGTDCDDTDPEVWEDCGEEDGGDEGGEDGGGDDGATDGSGDEGTDGSGSDGTDGSDGTADGGDGAAGDDGGTDETDAEDDTGGTAKDEGGCSAVGAAPVGMLALVGLVGAVRRRRD